MQTFQKAKHIQQQQRLLPPIINPPPTNRHTMNILGYAILQRRKVNMVNRLQVMGRESKLVKLKEFSQFQ